MKFRNRSFFLIFLCCLVFSGLNAETPSKWKEYSLKEVLGRLKFYAFAKIAQSVRMGAQFEEEILVSESSCEESFPHLEGNFQCAWLRIGTLESGNHSVKEEQSAGITSGSVASSSSYKAKWYEGKTLAGKGVLLIPGKNGSEDLELFYHTDGRLSHYSTGDRIVVFDWNGKELSTILSVKVDSQLRPLSGKEYFFP